MFETLLIKAIQKNYYFSIPVSKFPLTYRCEFIEDDAKGFLPPPPFYTSHKPYYTAPRIVLPLERLSS